MLACANTSAAPTIVQITKLLPARDAQSFRALGRVMSGVVRKGMGVRVLGEGFSAEDEEDMWKGDVADVWINEARWVLFRFIMTGGI
jgi:U5 small nuclear ribonucleoprotein component